MGYFPSEFDYVQGSFRVGAGLFAWLGHDPLPVEETYRRWTMLVKPVDLKKIKALRRHPKGQAVSPIPYRIHNAAGEWRWMQMRPVVREWTGEGYPARIDAVHTDVHEIMAEVQHYRASEQMFRSTFEQSPMGASILSEQCRLLRVNLQVCKLSGYSEQELLEMTCRDLTHPDDVPKEDKLREDLFSRKNPGFSYQIEKRMMRKDGHPVWVNSTVTLVECGEGESPLLLVLTRDISDRKLTADILRESEERYRSIFLAASNPIFIIAADTGLIVDANPAACFMYGYSYQELTRMRHVELCPHSEHCPGIDSCTTLYQRRTHRHKDGSPLVVELSVGHYTVEGRPFCIMAVTDLTAQTQLEREVVTFSETEQKRLGHEIHDTVCQELVAVLYSIESLRDSLASEQNPLVSRAQSAYETTSRAIDIARQLAHGLSPLENEPTALFKSLENIKKRCSLVFGLECELELDPSIAVNDRLALTQLYRIAQEAVINAVKHGHPDSIIISLRLDADMLILSVRNNGVSFDPETGHQGAGIGLRIMRYRAHLIGAEFFIAPLLQGGTEVRCLLRLSPDQLSPAVLEAS